jgi:hypothetical protein
MRVRSGRWSEWEEGRVWESENIQVFCLDVRRRTGSAKKVALDKSKHTEVPRVGGELVFSQ